MVAGLTRLYRFPVKSTLGEELQSAPVDRCIEFDRSLGIFDSGTGKLLSAKSVPRLLELHSLVQNGEVWLRHGEQSCLATSQQASEIVAEVVGRAVVIRSAQPAAIHHIDLELDDGDRATGMTTFETKPGWLFDSQSGLHLVSQATLLEMEQRLASAGNWQRYRPNLVVDGIPARAEDSWVGKQVRIGTMRALVRTRTERCVITSRSQAAFVDGGNPVPAERGVLRFLNGNYHFCVGIYLDVIAAGNISCGDRVELLD